jgi:hypothetical protein
MGHKEIVKPQRKGAFVSVKIEAGASENDSEDSDGGPVQRGAFVTVKRENTQRSDSETEDPDTDVVEKKHGPGVKGNSI